MAYIKILAIDADLDKVTLGVSSVLDLTLLDSLIVEHRLFESTVWTRILTVLDSADEWEDLEDGLGLEVDVDASDGVHAYRLLMGKQFSASSDASGVITGSVPAGTVYLAHASAPTVIYAYSSTTGIATGMTAGAGPLISYTADITYDLIMIAAETKLAADIRAKAILSCEAVKKLWPRHLDLQAASIRFNCRDYQGADWMVKNTNTLTSNCGC